MRYSMEETIGAQSFMFLEKLHNPIFLIHKNGSIKKINEAGRKLLNVARVSKTQLDHLIASLVPSFKLSPRFEVTRIPTQHGGFKVVSKQVGQTDYILVELIR